LESILNGLAHVNERLATVFVVHPRTRKRIAEFGLSKHLEKRGFVTVEPLGYLEMLSLVDCARMVLTDSGGLQEETTALGVPCLTLRENTERPVTVSVGTNALVGWKTDDIIQAADAILGGGSRPARVPDLWDGHAAERIVAILSSALNRGL
jgi:UDP-N-acetylglucosamine 2-epimerase (non-hydrolysing)